jgi:hypothetical protein
MRGRRRYRFDKKVVSVDEYNAQLQVLPNCPHLCAASPSAQVERAGAAFATLQKLGVLVKARNCLVFQGDVQAVALKTPQVRTRCGRRCCVDC